LRETVLVGVEAQQPVVFALLDRELLLGPPKPSHSSAHAHAVAHRRFPAVPSLLSRSTTTNLVRRRRRLARQGSRSAAVAFASDEDGRERARGAAFKVIP